MLSISIQPCVSCIVDVLAGLSALYIQRRFGNDFVDISDVTMETVAVASGNDAEVSYVENCTCDSSEAAGTLSCLTSSTSNVLSVCEENEIGRFFLSYRVITFSSFSAFTLF